jgi:tetratricopeptide (TPR) repeat protein
MLPLLPGCEAIQFLEPDAHPAIEHPPAVGTLNPHQSQLLTQGRDALAVGNYQEALTLFHDVLETNPTATPAYIGIGDVHVAVEDYAAAEPAYDRAATLAPANFDAQFGHGLALQMLDRFVEAIRAYHRALVVRPESPKTNLSLGVTYLQMDEPKRSIPFLLRAAELDRTSGVAMANLGVAQEQTGDAAAAAESYLAAAELMEPSPQLMTNIINVLVRQKRYREVVNTAHTLLKLDESSKVWERMGWAYFRLGEYEKSDAAYREAVDLDDRNYRALNGIGVNALNTWLLSSEEDRDAWTTARDAFRQSLKANPLQQKVVGLMLKYEL